MDTGELQTYEGPGGRELPIVRSGPPPCESCPKQSPENDHLYQLSPKNHRLLDFVRRARATPGFVMPQHLQGDQLLQESFAIIADIERDARSGEELRRLQHMMTMMISAG